MNEEQKKEKGFRPYLKKSVVGTSRELADRTLTLLVGAFGLVAALAWNEAVQKLIGEIFKKGNQVISSFVYAIAVTVVVVLITMHLGKIEARLKRPDGAGSEQSKQ